MNLGIELLRRNLSRRDKVTDAEYQLLRSLKQRAALYAKGADIIPEHSRPNSSCLLVAGLAGRAVSREDGRRQLTALHVPGDFVDLHGLLLRTMDHGVVALSNCEVIFVPHEDIISISETAPHLTRLLWTSTTIDAAIQRKMAALLGRHSPLQRLGHLICEIYTRLEIVGLATDGTFHFPVTQHELADILGISVVHTNRTVQQLRSTGLISWGAATVTIADMSALVRLAEFDTTYLSLETEPR